MCGLIEDIWVFKFHLEEAIGQKYHFVKKKELNKTFSQNLFFHFLFLFQKSFMISEKSRFYLFLEGNGYLLIYN
jgi:hypothetical protein